MALSPEFKKICQKLQYIDELIAACLQMDLAAYCIKHEDWIEDIDEIRRVLKLMGIRLHHSEPCLNCDEGHEDEECTCWKSFPEGKEEK
jgi:hypothetical protein